MTEHIKIELGLIREEDSLLTIKEIARRILPIEKGSTFTIRSLFNKEEWSTFSPGNKIGVPRMFSKNPGSFGAEYIGKNSANHSEYIKTV